jgi:hypothetical protein
MSSFDSINYSLRPSKSIQRQLVFDGVRILQRHLDLEGLIYIGFGSIWFSDFVMAHKLLDVNKMISIEGSEIGYRRALYNAPYKIVQVEQGFSYDVLPKFFVDDQLARPWMIWLDFDYELNESSRNDIRSVVEKAPANSILIVTFNGLDHKYGFPKDRPDRLRDLLGSVVPDELSREDCKDAQMQETLADLALAYMKSLAADIARPGGFVPAFRIVYKDGASMVTVGGVLPSKGAARVTADLVGNQAWPCRPKKPIQAPHLTIREAASLQSILPSIDRLTRVMVQELGFDLQEEQLEAFEAYYRQYPAYAQIIA